MGPSWDIGIDCEESGMGSSDGVSVGEARVGIGGPGFDSTSPQDNKSAPRPNDWKEGVGRQAFEEKKM